MRLPTGLTRSVARLHHSGLRRALHVSACTVERPSPESLRAALGDVPDTAGVLFSVSTSVAPESLGQLLSVLNSPGAVGSFHLSPGHVPEVALAVFTPDEGERVSPWYSSASGRAPASVGRWHRTDEPDWAEDERGSAPGELEGVLAGKGWEGVWAARGDEARIDLGSRVTTVLALTDGTPAPVLRALAPYRAATAGLVSAGTPFLTGRPYTLFHAGQAYSAGSVGLAISGSAPASSTITYGIEPLDAPTAVGAARGNLLLKLDGPNPNPTQTLIAAIAARDGKGRVGITKDEEFWLGIMEAGSPDPRMVRILSGDPSRGAISLETETPLYPGQVVQFMHRPGSMPTPSPLAGALRFAVAPRIDDVVDTHEGEAHTRPGFLATSEGGFIFASAGQDPAVCTVVGAEMTVEL